MSSSSPPRIASVLAAGGSGSRFACGDNKTAKQFIELRGYPIYVWSLLALASHKWMTDVVVVAPASGLDSINAQIKALVADRDLCRIHVTAGGATRQESVFCGLQYLKNDRPDYVLVHDAARPFLDLLIVDKVIEGVIKYGACTVGVPASDTIKRIKNGAVEETLDRSEILVTQTPQAASFGLLLAGHEESAKLGVATTDDAAILENMGHSVHVVAGNPYNIKVTEPLDLLICEALADSLLTDRL